MHTYEREKPIHVLTKDGTGILISCLMDNSFKTEFKVLLHHDIFEGKPIIKFFDPGDIKFTNSHNKCELEAELKKFREERKERFPDFEHEIYLKNSDLKIIFSALSRFIPHEKIYVDGKAVDRLNVCRLTDKILRTIVI